MLNEIQNHIAQVDFWYWFALGAVLLLKAIFRAKVPLWLVLVLFGFYGGLTYLTLNGEALASGVAMLLLGAAYVIGWPFLWMLFFVRHDPHYDNLRAKTQEQIEKARAALRDSFEVFPLDGSFFRVRILRDGIAALNLIDEHGKKIFNTQPITFESRKGKAYGEILIRGYWDCNKCNNRLISGVMTQCDRCGAAIEKGVPYYTPKDDKPFIAFTRAQAFELARHPEWVCEKCSRLNRNLLKNCHGCGAQKARNPRYAEGVAHMDAALAARWNSLWKLEDYIQSIPFDTMARSKNSFYLWAKILIVAFIALVVWWSAKIPGWQLPQIAGLPEVPAGNLVAYDNLTTGNIVVSLVILGLFWLYFEWLFLAVPISRLANAIHLPRVVCSLILFAIYWFSHVMIPPYGIAWYPVLWWLYNAQVWHYVKEKAGSTQSLSDKWVDFFLVWWFYPLLRLSGHAKKPA
jgi:hypothetical protein